MPGTQPRVLDTHWLNGVRGAAALFVVVHHLWGAAWPGFPDNNGPALLTPFLYGHLAVCVFIVLSGFSLAMGPLADGGRLQGGARRFMTRRAWRLVPAYWAALVLSVVVLLCTTDVSPAEAARSFVVHGLLLQDVIGSVSPNGTFWSIAVEWHIYFAFPLLLVLVRRRGPWTAAAVATAAVVAAYLLSGSVPRGEKVLDLTPQMYALFAMGVLAAKATATPPTALTRGRLTSTAVILTGAVVAAAAVMGPRWVVGNYFWVDLVFGAAVAALFASAVSGGAKPLSRFFSAAPLTGLGAYAYSLYLVQVPVLDLLSRLGMDPAGRSTGGQLLVWLLLLIFVCLASWIFYRFFERPFILERSVKGFLLVPGVGQLQRMRGRLRPARVPA